MGRVYVTGMGRLCPDCDRPIKECCCKQRKAQAATGDGRVRVQRQTKGRGGKTVTVVSGLPLAGAELKELAGEFKRRFGVGGAVKDGAIEIQGDYADALVDELKKRGYQAKRSGG